MLVALSYTPGPMQDLGAVFTLGCLFSFWFAYRELRREL